MSKEDSIRENISNVMKSGYIPELGKLYSGKVRDNHITGKRRVMVTTDRISAFDRILIRGIPFKGQVLNLLTAFWFEQTKDIVENHLLDVPDPNVMVVKESTPIVVEVVIRRYLSGSAWRSYIKKKEVSGIKLPDNLKEDQILPDLIITPTTKAVNMHDEEISREEIIEKNIIPEDVYSTIEETAIELFKRGEEILKKRGLTLVDTKYEFGMVDGRLILIDEIHTPDSSRFWEKDTKYQDKEYVRKWLREQGFMGDGEQPIMPDDMIVEVSRRYISIYEKITGKEFEFYQFPIKKRIVYNLKKKGYIKGCFVPLIIASDKDLDWAKKIKSELESFGINSGIHISSAHKTPEKLLEIIKTYENSIEPLVFIASAGMSDALSGMISANTKFPVIACPPDFNSNDVFSSLRTPSYVPSMVVLKPENAAMAAAKIFNLESVSQKILEYKNNIKRLNEELGI
jgi:phosphoribosylaminoimidazole-succinocarboxamide synthase